MTLETLIQDVPSVQDAHAIADRLVGAFPSIEAVLLCGSVARGDADNWSDIDLVVIGSDTELTASQLRQELPEWNDRVSLIYYPMSSFQKLYQESTLFVAHLKRERVVLYDRLNLLTNLLKDSSQRTVDIAEEIRAHRAKLAPYTDPQPFNNNFLFV